MSGEHVTENLAAYALGVLDGADLLAVARHLPGCPACRAELAAWYRTAEALSVAVPPREPPSDLRRRVVERTLHASRAAGTGDGVEASIPVAAPRPVASPQRRRGFLAWLPMQPAIVFSAIALIAVLVVGNLLQWRQINTLRAAQSTSAPNQAVMVQLKGTASMPEATGVMITFPGSWNGSLTVDNLPALDAEHQYQLWLVEGDDRISGGVFSVTARGYGVLHVITDRPLEGFDRFGVTVEPAGGSPSPTGEKVLGSEG